MSAPRKLRIGILIDSVQQPAWVRTMLERIAHSDHAELSLVVQNEASRPRLGLLGKLRTHHRIFMYLLLERLEARLFRLEPDAFAMGSIEALIEGLPRIGVSPRQGEFSDWIEGESLDEIRSYDVDVLLRLGFRILRGGILQAARHGVWSFHHGDNHVNRGGPAGFWEVYERHPATGSILQILNEDLDNGIVLDRSWSATDPLSIRRSLNVYYWKSLEFVPRRLRQLHEMGSEAFQQRTAELGGDLSVYSRRLYVAPGNAELIGLAARHLARNLWRKVRERFMIEQWFLMLDVRRSPAIAFRRYRSLIPPPDRYWADPFVVRREGRYFLFFEELLHRAEHGRISVLELDEKGRPAHETPAVALQRPYHLSYPFLFEYEGELFMIPETSENRTIECYRCVELPERWELHATLMEGVTAVDATLHQHGESWWLFVNIEPNPGASTWDELHLFHADRPFGTEWRPHPQNPIVSDVRRARPAGALFEHAGRLYRPAQDCGRVYGYGLRFHEVLRMDETEYEEREVAFAEPNFAPHILGIHTFNRAHRLTVIDAKRRRWRFQI
jgi:hypothetical protein